MPGIFAVLLINAGLYLLGQLFRPRPEKGPQPGGIGDVSAALAAEGGAVPKVWGTCLLKGTNVLWYGNVRPKPIKVDGQDSGRFRYTIGIHYGICSGPVDEILEIKFDGKRLKARRDLFTDYTRFTAAQEDMFGGEAQEGGVIGPIDVYFGTETQAPPPGLQTSLPREGSLLDMVANQGIPAYRGWCHAFSESLYVGTSLYLKEMSIVVRACPNQLGLTAGKHNINGDANPACMLYDLWTSPPHLNGLGLDPADIDVANLVAIGETLHSEGLGLSMVQDQATNDADDIEREILRHIDAIRFTDPVTGLRTIRLARADYVVGDLPVLDPTNCELESWSRPGWEELTNAVTVTYSHREKVDAFAPIEFSVRTAPPVYDLAAIGFRQGRVSLEEIQFKGFSNLANASWAAARSARALGYPLMALALMVNRLGRTLRPGAVAVLNWPPLGISGMVIRVTGWRGGTLLDGTISMNAVEDVFGTGLSQISQPPANAWVDPSSDVGDLLAGAIVPAPYPYVEAYVPIPELQARALCLAAPGAGLPLGFNAILRRADDLEWLPPVPIYRFTPVGSLVTALTPTSTSIVLLDQKGLDLVQSTGPAQLARGDSLVYLGGEFIAFRDIEDNLDGTFTLSTLVRGCIDTTPRNHPDGSLGWVIGPAPPSVGMNVPVYPSTLSINQFRLQPFNIQGTFDIDDLADITVAAPAIVRAVRPYCPTGVRLNGSSYPATIAGALALTWLHRNRLGSWSYTDAGVTAAPEPGTTYKVVVYGELGTVVHTAPGLDGTSWTYSTIDEIADSGLGRLNTSLRILIHAVRDGIESWLAFDHTVARP